MKHLFIVQNLESEQKTELLAHAPTFRCYRSFIGVGVGVGAAAAAEGEGEAAVGDSRVVLRSCHHSTTDVFKSRFVSGKKTRFSLRFPRSTRTKVEVKKKVRRE